MFDIGFWELATIAIIGIVVVGPERLPEVVRTIAAYVRKARRALNNVKSDIERELDLDDLRRQMHDIDMEDHIKKLNQSVMDLGQDSHDAVAKAHNELRRSLDLDDPEVRAGEAPQADETDPLSIDLGKADDHHPDPDPAAAERYADTGVETTPQPPRSHD